MKLLRYGARGHEQPGVLDSEGQIRSLAGIIPDIDGALVGGASLESKGFVEIIKNSI